MGLGNRQKQSGHLMLIRQKQRYDFGSDRSKMVTRLIRQEKISGIRRKEKLKIGIRRVQSLD